MSPRLRRMTALLLVAVGATPAIARGEDNDSPWPRSASNRVQLDVTRKVVADLEGRLEMMRLTAARYATWETCLRGVPVSEFGDPDRQSGYAYDEGDGSGRSFMPALAVDRKSRPRREDYLFLDFRGAASCRSAAPQPGGTAEAAAVQPRIQGVHTPAPGHSLRALERRVTRLRREAQQLEVVADRFDAWESCVSWVPVTQHGDPDGRYGYLFQPPGPTSPFVFRPALSIDRSDWDDPDYMFLAFVGGDRPGGVCRNEPGEGVD